MKIDEIKDMILEDQKKVKDLNSLNDLKVKYLGKKGLIRKIYLMTFMNLRKMNLKQLI